MNNILPLPTHLGDRISWNGLAGIVDASELCCRGKSWDRVWNDSCDEGFWLESHRTGEKRLMLLEATNTDADGDARSWVFRAYVKGRPSDIVLTVINS